MNFTSMDTIIVFAVGIFTGYWIAKLTASPNPEQTKLMQKNLDELIDSLSTTERSQIEIELKKNRKISAIKIFRKATGSGLKDANDAVTKMMTRSH